MLIVIVLLNYFVGHWTDGFHVNKISLIIVLYFEQEISEAASVSTSITTESSTSITESSEGTKIKEEVTETVTTVTTTTTTTTSSTIETTLPSIKGRLNAAVTITTTCPQCYV